MSASTQVSLIVDDAQPDVFRFNNDTAHAITPPFYYLSTAHLAFTYEQDNLTDATIVDISFEGEKH